MKFKLFEKKELKDYGFSFIVLKSFYNYKMKEFKYLKLRFATDFKLLNIFSCYRASHELAYKSRIENIKLFNVIT